MVNSQNNNGVGLTLTLYCYQPVTHPSTTITNIFIKNTIVLIKRKRKLPHDWCAGWVSLNDLSHNALLQGAPDL